MYVPDNYDMFRQREAEEERWLKGRPQCENCREPIQDEVLFDIDGKLYCEECMNDLFRRNTEDYERRM